MPHLKGQKRSSMTPKEREGNRKSIKKLGDELVKRLSHTRRKKKLAKQTQRKGAALIKSLPKDADTPAFRRRMREATSRGASTDFIKKGGSITFKKRKKK